MPAFGLVILSIGSVLTYCAIKDISVTDFFRGLVSGVPAQPRAPAGVAGPTPAPGAGTGAPAGPTGPVGQSPKAGG